MSLFRVKLNNSKQGLMDLHNNQRSVYIMGPNKVNRILKDGEEFIDCNYWKRFAYPALPLEEAFIEVVEDDGTIYSDFLDDNTYPKVYDIVAAPNSGFSENIADIEKDTGGFAIFAQITNKSETNSVKVKINKMNSAVISLEAGNTQVFNAGEISIGSLEIENNGEEPVVIQIIVSIRIKTTS